MAFAKSNIIERISETLDLSRNEAKDTVDELLEILTTGQKVQMAPKKLPFFKCGKELKKRVDFQAKGGK